MSAESTASIDDAEFVAPTTVAEAVTALGHEEALVLAGGTSVGLLIGQGLVASSRLVWLGRIPELRGIGRCDDGIRVGASVTLRQLAADPLIRSEVPSLAAAAAAVGNTRIRAVATVGGALAHGDPRQDLPPVLLAHGARVELAGPRGRHRMPLDELATGFLSTCIEEAEIVTEVVIPVVARRRGRYHRFTPTSVDDYPTVAVAVTVVADPDGLVTDATVAVGGAASTAYVVPAAASLVGSRPDGAAVARVGAAAAALARPVDDRLGSADYKRAMVEVWTGRTLASCLADSGALRV